jgi:hypothetical protein
VNTYLLLVSRSYYIQLRTGDHAAGYAASAAADAPANAATGVFGAEDDVEIDVEAVTAEAPAAADKPAADKPAGAPKPEKVSKD